MSCFPPTICWCHRLRDSHTTLTAAALAKHQLPGLRSTGERRFDRSVRPDSGNSEVLTLVERRTNRGHQFPGAVFQGHWDSCVTGGRTERRSGVGVHQGEAAVELKVSRGKKLPSVSQERDGRQPLSSRINLRIIIMRRDVNNSEAEKHSGLIQLRGHLLRFHMRETEAAGNTAATQRQQKD
ncbi:unnamed protein product [Pleuronectes platessa]|uniref:Uncharacterized protein n=1 Tax=Pleuronectes platessa TaxID=8262 RepID=A0A9N7U7D5_PLEPL|nr:unnamed protein product [Pleuronectes platessa]